MVYGIFPGQMVGENLHENRSGNYGGATIIFAIDEYTVRAINTGHARQRSSPW